MVPRTNAPLIRKRFFMTEEETKLWARLRQVRLEMRFSIRDVERYHELEEELKNLKKAIAKEKLNIYREERKIENGEYKRK